MYFFIGLFWALAGIIVSLPCTWLADGSPENFVWTMFFGPPTVIILAMVYLSCREAKRDGEKLSMLFFWGAFTITTLPIIMRLASIGINAIGWPRIAKFVFQYRYTSLSVLFMVATSLMFIRMVISVVTEFIKDKIEAKKLKIPMQG